MEFPEDLMYTKEHCWVRFEGNIATIGLAADFCENNPVYGFDYGNIGYPVVGDVIFTLTDIGGTHHEFTSPFQGVGPGQSMETTAIYNEDAFCTMIGQYIYNMYDEFWFYKVVMKYPDSREGLMTAAEYRAFIGM